MKRLVKWSAALAGLLLLAVAVTAGVGCLLPRSHTITRSVALPVPTETVWQTVVNQQEFPSWWPACKSSVPVPAGDGRTVWRQSHECGIDCELEVTESVPGRRLVTTITDSAAVFSGRWEYSFEPAGDGCLLTITETGEIPNPLIRALARLGDQAETLDSFVAALARRVGR